MGKTRLPAGHPRRAPVAAPGSDGEPLPRNKTRLTMYLDTTVVEYFRSRAGGRGYQTLINEALRRAIEQENLESVLRRVIREEARPYQAGKAKS
ncbi:MAG TPA: BrnA antitoxin family protein [Burkholderiales bacterium]|nr:BrnA antitoxin family protein [Burkholderiales bacterium]